MTADRSPRRRSPPLPLRALLLSLLVGTGACTDRDPDPSPASEMAEAAQLDAHCDPSSLNLTAVFDHVLHGRYSACELRALEAFAQRRARENGPWRQEIRVARSADGLSFAPVEGPPIVKQAGVPEVHRGPTGRYYLYYVDGSLDHLVEQASRDPRWFLTHGLPGLGALRLAVSDDGIHFEEEPAFEVQGIVPGMVVDPEVMRMSDGTWRMYYVGMPFLEYLERATWAEGEPHEVFYATSTDLVHWEQQGMALRGPYADPAVHCREDDSCLMLSFGLDWSTSVNGGTSFTHHGSWGPPGFAPDFLALPEGRTRLFYNDKRVTAPVRSMISEDGRNWEPEEGRRLPGYGEAVSVVKRAAGKGGENGFLMYFHGFSNEEDVPYQLGGEEDLGYLRHGGGKGAVPKGDAVDERLSGGKRTGATERVPANNDGDPDR